MKSWIKCIIAGAVIFVVGIGVIIGTLAFNGWSVKSPKFDMQTYTAEKDNNTIDITVGAGSVKTEFYDGEKITIDYPSASMFESEISEDDGIFRYRSRVKRFWFLGAPSIPETVIKLPKNIVFNLDFDVNAGSVSIAGGEYSAVKINVDAGKLTVNESVCENFECEVNAGYLEAINLTCSKFDCEVSAGKLDVKKLDCPCIIADVSAGTLVMNVAGAKSDYEIRADVSAGSCNIGNQWGGNGKKLEVECSAGSIYVSFES